MSCNAKKDPNGTWRIQYRWTDWTGTKKKSQKRGFKTKKEAEEWYAHFMLQQSSDPTMTLADFWEIYKADMEKRLRKTTMKQKEYVMNDKVLPYFGKTPINEITAPMIRKWQGEMMDKGFKPTYLKTIHNQLSAILNYAVNFYDLRSNPCRKAGSMGKSKADERPYWTLEEFQKFSDAIMDKQDSWMAFQILFWTGMRIGELLALTPADFDFQACTIRINKSYQRLEGKDIITDPKTVKSNRMITMPEFLSEVEEIEWLFYPFIPYGKVTIIQGDPGEGKTTVVLQIIAKLTKGEAILSETSEGKSEETGVESINVIYQTAEDGLGDTIKPRLLAARADCSRVLVIDDQDQPLTMVDARLEEAIIQTKARLVVLDPIQGFLGAGVDMHRANEIRPLMKRISVLAEKYQCAIILIGHMNKNSNGKSSYRGLGSIDFQAAARSVLIVGRVKDEPEIRVICHVKSSLAPEGDAIAFRLDKEKGFHWIGKYDISAEDLLSGDGRGQKI